MDGMLVFIVLLALLFFSAFKILREYERGVIFLLGRFWKVKGPGLIIVIPGIQKMVKVSLRTVVMDVPPQDIITKDNVTVKVNAVIYFRVVDPQKAIIDVEDFLYATSQLAQTTLRSILGQSQLDELLANREAINTHLQRVIDEQTEPWGVKVINAQGEFEAAQKIAEAADVIGAHPPALQLRFLQTIVDISSGQSTTTFFPIPIELMKPFIDMQLNAAKNKPE